MEPRRRDAGVNALGSGTGLRFVLLVVLVSASTVAIVPDHPALAPLIDPRNDMSGCLIAAGFDPTGTEWGNIAATLGRNNAALDACVARFAMPWWVPVAVVVAVFGLAAGLCWVMPRWMISRRALRPVDPASEAGAALRALAERVGHPSARFLADWASGSVNAVAFGRPGSAWIALPGGLLATRTTEPDRFTAIVLHELAHLRYRDVGITYATIAVWRVFAIVMLVPYLGLQVTYLVTSQFYLTGDYFEVMHASSGPTYARSVALCLFLAALVYLSRSDILRARELYADRRAVNWGASQAIWETERSTSARRSRIANLASALLGVHPSWRRRAQALRDPEILLRVPALPTFLTGAAAAMIARYLATTPSPSAPLRAGPVLAGLLVAGTTYLTIWRRTTHAIADGRAAPEWLGPGFWLGAGLAVGSQFVGQSSELYRLVPLDTWGVLLMWLVAGGLTAWTAQCAYLLVTAVPQRWVRIPAAVGLLGAAVVLAVWLQWWLSTLWLFQPEIVASTWAHTGQLLGVDPAASPWLAGFVLALTVLGLISPAMLLSAALLWMVPLTAWLGPSSGVWLRRSGLPSFGRLLILAVLLGAAPVVLMALGGLRLLVADVDPGDTGSFLGFHGVLFGVCLAGPLLAGVLAAALSRSRAAVVAGVVDAGLALAVSSVGLALLAITPGCLGPGIDAPSACAGFGSADWDVAWLVIQLLLGPGTVVVVALALTVAVLVGAVRRLARRSELANAADPVRAVGPALVARRVTAGAVLLLAVGLVGPVAAAQIVPAGMPPPETPVSGLTAPVPASQQVRGAQVYAWVRYGGGDLLVAWAETMSQIAGEIDGAVTGEPDSVAAVRSGCAAAGRWAVDAAAYFTIPDPEQQGRWEQAQAIVSSASADCIAASDRGDAEGLSTAFNRMGEALMLISGVTDWLASWRL